MRRALVAAVLAVTLTLPHLAAAQAVPDGFNAALGSTQDNVCLGDTTKGCTLQARMQRLVTLIDQLLTANAQPIAVTPAPSTTTGCTPYGLQSAASTNSTSVAPGAHVLCGGVAANSNGTIYYLRLYDSATAPTCSSATNYVLTIPIPANVAVGGIPISFGTYGANFTNGIAWCITGGASSTDNTNAATGVFVNIGYK